MLRAALILALVLVNFFSCFVEEIYLALRPLQRGQSAPFTLRADLPLARPANEAGPPPIRMRVDFQAGEVLVPFLKKIDQRDQQVIRLFEEQRLEAVLQEAPLILFANIWMVVFLGFFLFALPRGGYKRAVSHPLLLVLLILQGMILKMLLLFTVIPVEGLPLALLPLLIIALNQGRVTALGTFLVGMLLAAFFLGKSYEILTSFLVIGLTSIMLAPRTLRLHNVLLPCLLIGAVHAVFLTLQKADWLAIAQAIRWPEEWNWAVWGSLAANPWVKQCGWAFMGGALSGAFALLLLPVIKAGRTVGSTFSLRRFADLDQPLLKKLFVEAPGTYQHSMNVAYLAQAAGDAIGANPLLLRIGAYFHDIGKMQQPEGYIENQRNGVNLHDALDPYESTEIITGHVPRGMLICRDARLPKTVIDLIQQHHGTQLVDFFFKKALKRDPQRAVREEDFRYAGPKPQNVEAALLMIADAVEASSRSLTAPSRPAFEKLVRFIVVKRIADGQFSECVLDTRDIDAVIRAVVDALEAAFHSRIRYPWQQPHSAQTQKSG
jgi:putative nucleotidyltransferase with HDIG domain